MSADTGLVAFLAGLAALPFASSVVLLGAVVVDVLRRAWLERRRRGRLQLVDPDWLAWSKHRERDVRCICPPCTRGHRRRLAERVARATRGSR